MAAGAALQKYRDRLADQQEIIGALADIVLEIYPMESALLRAQKSVASRGKDSSGAIVAAAQVLLQDGAARVEANARTALAASVEGDMLRTQLAVLRRMIKREPADTIGLRRDRCRCRAERKRLPLRGALGCRKHKLQKLMLFARAASGSGVLFALSFSTVEL